MYRYWKLISLVLVLFITFAGKDYPVRRVCENPDGTLSITSYMDEYKLSNETDKEFLDRIDIQENMNSALGKVCTDVHKDDIPYNTLEDSEKWRVKEQGGKKIVFVDQTAPSPEKDKREKHKNDSNSAKAKLRSGQPMSQDEVNALFP